MNISNFNLKLKEERGKERRVEKSNFQRERDFEDILAGT